MELQSRIGRGHDGDAADLAESPCLKAARRCPVLPRSPSLSHRRDSFSVCGDLHSPGRFPHQSVTILDCSSRSNIPPQSPSSPLSDMPDCSEGAPASCQVIKEDVDKCVRERGVEDCKDLIDAFQACIKTLSEGS
ncbi:unnamed protein product [Pleuronectes platessa]|uniref:Uncharacterized protein n=1 Tax=Pleuronectes platessa TaxID=8262 RepID=A0A9N7Y4U3_PLEPL|nr:unnamed protein product [Pleuronectes platessa]